MHHPPVQRFPRYRHCLVWEGTLKVAFTFLIVGALLLTAGVRDTQAQLFTLVQGDLTGKNNFIFWMLSILLIGAVGYVPKLKPFSIAMLTLVVLVLLLKRGDPTGVGGGFFSQLTKQLNLTQQAATPAATTPTSMTPVYTI